MLPSIYIRNSIIEEFIYLCSRIFIYFRSSSIQKYVSSNLYKTHSHRNVYISKFKSFLISEYIYIYSWQQLLSFASAFNPIRPDRPAGEHQHFVRQRQTRMCSLFVGKTPNTTAACNIFAIIKIEAIKTILFSARCAYGALLSARLPLANRLYKLYI